VLVTISFYVLAAVAVAAAFMVVASRNPVHSVMYLILTFFSAAGLFILMGAEFLALLIVMVYVGAVAVLFLFVVMMLDVDFVELKQGFLQYLPIGGLVAIVLLIEMFLVGAAYYSGSALTVVERDPDVSNLEAFVLTLRERDGVRKQNILEQNARTRETGVEHVDIEPGQGIG